MTFTPNQIAYVDIYPPICIARVGDSSEYIIAPEVPGVEPTPDGGFKDKEFKIKKQAARFRVYAFDKDSKVLGEIADTEYTMNWKVHVANKKGAWVKFRGRLDDEEWMLRNYTNEPKKDGERGPDGRNWPKNQPKTYDYTNTRTWLIIDSEEQTIHGANAQPVPLKGDFWGTQDSATSVQLGELRTDEQGRLLVLASDGHSVYMGKGDEKLEDGFDNDNWVDKMCDGTVRVTVKSKSQPELDIPVRNRATVMTAPPRFSAGTHCLTTLYELIEDIHERPRRLEPGYDVGEVVYYRDIYPLFKRAYLLSWVNTIAAAGPKGNRPAHGANHMQYFKNEELGDPNPDYNATRLDVFEKIRVPVIDGNEENEKTRDQQAYWTFMPALSGDAGRTKEGLRDRWVSLTQLQYGRLKKWSEGKFTTGKPEAPYESFDKIPLDEQPGALTKAGIEWTIGAALYPGIEFWWTAQKPEMYKPAKPDQPGDRFRFADTVTPGDLGKGLSLPWQSDFNMCNGSWWPSVRPDDVVPAAIFEAREKVTQPDQLARSFKLEDRKLWARGIDGTGLDQCLEMVQKWHKLGFVARQRYETKPEQLEIHIERQRHPDMPL